MPLSVATARRGWATRARMWSTPARLTRSSASWERGRPAVVAGLATLLGHSFAGLSWPCSENAWPFSPPCSVRANPFSGPFWPAAAERRVLLALSGRRSPPNARPSSCRLSRRRARSDTESLQSRWVFCVVTVPWSRPRCTLALRTIRLAPRRRRGPAAGRAGGGGGPPPRARGGEPAPGRAGRGRAGKERPPPPANPPVLRARPRGSGGGALFIPTPAATEGGERGSRVFRRRCNPLRRARPARDGGNPGPPRARASGRPA